jgi:hypothetical protein
MVSHEAVTLQTISNNHRLSLMINDHLPLEEAYGEHSSNHKKLKT